MKFVSLSPFDLSIAALLIAALCLLSTRMKLDIGRQIFIAGIRTTIQLLLIGLVLKALFDHVNLIWLTLIAFVMLLAAGREVRYVEKSVHQC